MKLIHIIILLPLLFTGCSDSDNEATESKIVFSKESHKEENQTQDSRVRIHTMEDLDHQEAEAIYNYHVTIYHGKATQWGQPYRVKAQEETFEVRTVYEKENGMDIVKMRVELYLYEDGTTDVVKKGHTVPSEWYDMDGKLYEAHKARPYNKLTRIYDDGTALDVSLLEGVGAPGNRYENGYKFTARFVPTHYFDLLYEIASDGSAMLHREYNYRDLLTHATVDFVEEDKAIAIDVEGWTDHEEFPFPRKAEIVIMKGQELMEHRIYELVSEGYDPEFQ